MASAMSAGGLPCSFASPSKNLVTHASAGTSPSNASAMCSANSSASISAGRSSKRSIARQRICSSEGPVVVVVVALCGIELALGDGVDGQLEDLAGRLAAVGVELGHLPAHRPRLLEVPAADLGLAVERE